MFVDDIEGIVMVFLEICSLAMEEMFSLVVGFSLWKSF
jgi:hypothetical protein